MQAYYYSMKKRALLGTILALGCQMAEAPAPDYFEALRVQRAEQEEGKPRPIEETFFAVCHDNDYDFDSRCIDFTHGQIAAAKNSVYQFNQTIEAEIFGMGETRDLDGICSSILLQEGHLLTAQHCVDLEPPWFVNILKQDFSITYNRQKYALEKIALGGDTDIALFKVKEYEGLPYLPFAIGDTDKITEGNLTYLFGYKGTPEVHVREGIVSAAEDTFLHGIFGEGHFLITNGVDRGDSGGLVMGFRDGMPEILGITLYRYATEHAGGILKIEKIPEEILRRLR